MYMVKFNKNLKFSAEIAANSAFFPVFQRKKVPEALLRALSFLFCLPKLGSDNPRRDQDHKQQGDQAPDRNQEGFSFLRFHIGHVVAGKEEGNIQLTVVQEGLEAVVAVQVTITRIVQLEGMQVQTRQEEVVLVVAVERLKEYRFTAHQINGMEAVVAHQEATAVMAGKIMAHLSAVEHLGQV